MGSEQIDLSGRYLYERLGEKRFQQLCAALLKITYPDVTCYPVGQRDGGRDVVGRHDGGVIFQVKWAKGQPRNPVAWLDSAVRGEADNIRALADAGAGEYVLMTSVVGTAAPRRGTMDQLDERLAEHAAKFGIPMRCEWREDIDRRVEPAPAELKWTYQEMLAGVEAVRYLIEADNLAAHEQELRTLLLKVMETQWHDDAKVKFKQVELDSRNLMDLFVDVEAIRVTGPGRADQAQRAGFTQAAGRMTRLLGGAAEYLLSATQPLTVVHGAPGQGKSTLGQYLCQVHRAEFVPNDAYRSGGTPLTKAVNPRLPIRIDLRDYASWLSGGAPFADIDTAPTVKQRERRQGSVEQFLAELLRAKSGGLHAAVKTVQDVLHRFPMLIVLDGLDEVAQPRLRSRVVKEIDEFSARLGASLSAPQLIVTTRPNASGMPEPSADTFETITLSQLSTKLRTMYLRKWADAHTIRGKDRRDLERTFQQRSAEPHIQALADNPMQLTILLYLINKRGTSIPSARTELYTSYMETLLDREAAKTPAVDEFRKDLEEVTAYLGWHLQSQAETSGGEGRLTFKALRKVILGYLVGVEKDISMVDALFTGVTDRVWALSSRVQGTYEFDVQPLREYFAARFLNEFAGADLPNFDKSAVLRHLVRRAYWLNTARFFAGFANPNELAGLVEGLADECDELVRPNQTRLAAWTLLTDGVFTARTRTKRNVAALFGDHLSTRLLAYALTRNPETPIPIADRGGQEVVDLLHTQLIDDPESSLTAERVAIILKLQNRDSFDAWWLPQLRDAAGGPQQTAWLRIGSPVHAASRLAPADCHKLGLTNDADLPYALSAGVIPTPESQLESRMVHAVLAGQCSDLAGASPGLAADLLKILAPQHLLRKGSSQSQAYRFPVGHLDLPLVDPQRNSAMRRLIARDERFKQVQHALRFNRGQTGTTSPWANTARALTAIYGPCWLAAEIAVIGAALPPNEFTTGGDLTKGADPFGPEADYGRLLQQVRFNRNKTSWWADQFTQYEDPLSRATWALALVATASPQALVANLGKLDIAATQLPQPMLHALLASSSRIGASGLARPLSIDDFWDAAATPSTAATALLVAHYAAAPDVLSPYSDQQLGDHSRYGTSAWPALLTLTTRMTAKPSPTLLAYLSRFGATAMQPPFSLGPESGDYHRPIILNPADYPLELVLAAERQMSSHTNDAPLTTIANQAEWFPL